MQKWSVYVLKSLKDGKNYIGCTSKTLEKRLAEHNSGMVRSTKPRRPLRLVYSEDYEGKIAAFKREWYLKHPEGYREKREIINKIGGL